MRAYLQLCRVQLNAYCRAAPAGLHRQIVDAIRRGDRDGSPVLLRRDINGLMGGPIDRQGD